MSNLLQWTITAGITLLIISGIVIGVGAFRDSIADNTTTGYQVLNDTLNMFENTGDQLATVGTMIGVGLLIGVILVAFVGFSAGRKRGYF